MTDWQVRDKRSGRVMHTAASYGACDQWRLQQTQPQVLMVVNPGGPSRAAVDPIRELAAAIVVPQWGHKHCGSCGHVRYNHAERQGWFSAHPMQGRCTVEGCTCDRYDFYGQT